jgi:hypothetical protein
VKREGKRERESLTDGEKWFLCVKEAEKRIEVKREGQRERESLTDGEKMVSLHEGDRENKIAVKREGQRERESLTDGEKWFLCVKEAEKIKSQ